MRWRVLLALGGAGLVVPLLLSDAGAEDPPKQRGYTLTLTLPEIQQIGMALGKLPYGEVAMLYQKISQQVADQEKKADEKRE